MDDVVSRAADQLYTAAPQRFVADRAAAVAAARAAGDRVSAAAIGKLRRPSVAAWLVNLLALRRPELVAELAQLAESLQAAQRRLDGAQLRELAGHRRATVSGLVAEARSLAVAEEPQLAEGKLPLAEVEATLHAALADPEVAEQVRSGRLVRAATPAGFGEPPPARLRLVTGDAADQPTGDQPTGDRATGDQSAQVQLTDEQRERRAREHAEAALGDARAAATAASTELDRCIADQRATQQELAEIDAALAELAARRGGTADRLTAAEAASFAARRAAAEAQRRVAEAEAALAEPQGG